MADQSDRPLQELSAALQEFAASTRFNFLKTLQVGRFVQHTTVPLGVVSEFTFEKLVELGTKKLTKLKWLNRQQEEQLVSLLRALTRGEPITTAPPPPRPKNSTVRDAQVKDSDDEEQLLGSVQVELALREQLKKIQSHPQWAELRNQQLSAFWDPDWARAPFEEALTVEQLSEMDLTMLMKKKTMTNRRISLIAKALERAIGDRASPEPTRKPRAEQQAPLRLVRQDAQAEIGTVPPEVIEHPWLAELEGVNPLVRIAVESFVGACARAASAPGALDRAISKLSSELDGREFLCLVGLGSGSGPRSSEMERHRGWLHSIEFERATSPVRGLLESPGTDLVRIAELLDPNFFTGAVRDLCAQVLARLLGAVEVSLAGKVCEGVWTCNPELVVLVAQSVNRGPASFGDALNRVCPSLDRTLRSWLCEHGPKSRRRGGARSARKILPN